MREAWKGCAAGDGHGQVQDGAVNGKELVIGQRCHPTRQPGAHSRCDDEKTKNSISPMFLVRTISRHAKPSQVKCGSPISPYSTTTTTTAASALVRTLRPRHASAILDTGGDTRWRRQVETTSPFGGVPEAQSTFFLTVFRGAATAMRDGMLTHLAKTLHASMKESRALFARPCMADYHARHQPSQGPGRTRKKNADDMAEPFRQHTVVPRWPALGPGRMDEVDWCCTYSTLLYRTALDCTVSTLQYLTVLRHTCRTGCGVACVKSDFSLPAARFRPAPLSAAFSLSCLCLCAPISTTLCIDQHASLHRPAPPLCTDQQPSLCAFPLRLPSAPTHSTYTQHQGTVLLSISTRRLRPLLFEVSLPCHVATFHAPT